jgi:hypothetical protein
MPSIVGSRLSAHFAGFAAAADDATTRQAIVTAAGHDRAVMNDLFDQSKTHVSPFSHAPHQMQLRHITISK